MRKAISICAGLLFTGMILQLSLGKIDPELFCFPVNLILGALFLLCLLLFHLTARKIEWLQWFAGHTAGITSLASLFFLIIIMGLTRQLPSTLDVSHERGLIRMGFSQMTVSWPFLLLSLYFLWVLGLVVLRRLSRFQWKDTGFILNHAGLFIAFFAALLGSSDLQRLRMTVPLHDSEWRATNEKKETVELPLTIQLNVFIVDEYPPRLMIVDNITGEALPPKKPQSLSVETYPLSAEYLDWQLEITQYLPAAAAIIHNDTVNFVAFPAEGATAAFYVKAHNGNDGIRKEGWISCGNYLFPHASLQLNEKVSLIMPAREPKSFTSDVTVHTQSGKIKSALIEVNKPLSIDGWKIYQSSYDAVKGKWSRYSVFELVKDPWLPGVWLGIGMLLAGSIFLFVSAPKKKD